MSRMRRVGSGFAAAPLRLRAAWRRGGPVAALPAASAFDRGLPARCAWRFAFAFASAMTAFVSGDVSRVAAFANLPPLPARSPAPTCVSPTRGRIG